MIGHLSSSERVAEDEKSLGLGGSGPGGLPVNVNAATGDPRSVRRSGLERVGRTRGVIPLFLWRALSFRLAAPAQRSMNRYSRCCNDPTVSA